MRPSRCVLLAALAATGCHTEGKNPFQPQGRMVPIPASARLIFTSNAYGASAGAPREVFSLRADGSELTRLTYCNVEGSSCDHVAAAASPDRTRLALLRIQTDGNGDGRLGPPDDADVMIVDLPRAILAPLVSAAVGSISVDWSAQDFIAYCARGIAVGETDIYRVLPDGTGGGAVTASANLSDRALRLDPQGTFGVFERSAAGGGKTVVWAILNGLTQLTNGAADTGALLAGTPYLVGSDATPAFSPDDREVVYRRLVSTSPAGLGGWELRVLTIATRAERSLTSDVLSRGAPDWGPEGIVFPETVNNQTRLVLLDPSGANRRVLLTLPPGQSLSSVRWLP